MKCQKCGMEIPENTFRCEKCGNDIHIVPDYDPELEDHILDSIGHVTEKLPDVPSRRKELSLRFVWITVSACLCGLIAAVSFVILLITSYSYDYQISRAKMCMSNSRYDKAVYYYDKAIAIKDEDAELYFSVANAYLQQGNKLEYEYILTKIIAHPFVNEEQLERAYGSLIAIYKERGEYDTINDILQSCGLNQITKAYQSYLALPPSFNYEEGTYDKAIPLKLTACTAGIIYYTLDGTIPNQESSQYTSPILLEQENMIVTAMFINEYGVASEAVSFQYDVIIDVDEGPEVSVISGKYSSPMFIEIVDNESKDVYYTIDGSTPNLHSYLYTGPISMPLGKSEFSFAFVAEDGTSSEVVKREYDLQLNSNVSVEDAEALVVEYMLILKKIILENGLYSNETSAKYLYKYQSVMPLEGYGDYYVIAEFHQDEEGLESKTGSYYAVDIYKKECFKLSRDEDGNYTLIAINLNDA